MPRSYTLAASGGDVFRNFVFPLPIDSPKYVKAVEIRPGNKKVVHHANLLIDRTRTFRRRAAPDGQPGFPGMDVAVESNFFDPDSHFLFWKPGTPPHVEPAGMALPLDKGADLVLNMHLQPSGKPEEIQASVGLYFTDRAPVLRPMLLQLEYDGALDIPPGARAFTVQDTFTLPVAVEALGVYPHAHYIGKRIDAWATLPDGARRPLIRIEDWDINWQAVYRYRQPVALPKGALLTMRWTFDNSDENPRNPNRPPKRVRAGNRSQDEMAHLWIQVLPSGPESGGRLALQEALMRRRLEKYPREFTAHFNLGAALLSRGRTEEAGRHLRDALKIEPGSAAALTNLGAAYESRNQADEAMAQYAAALEADPGYRDARYNLARLLAAREKFDEAAAHFRELYAADAEDGEARARLLEALKASAARQASGQRFDEMIGKLRELASLQPGDADARNDLGTALAMAGRFAEAVPEFEAALQLQPSHQVARRNLALARKRLGRRD